MLMQLTIMTRYSRKYFLSADKNFRLTIDWDLEYQDILLSTLDTGKLLLLDVLHTSYKIDSNIIQDAAWLMETLEENYSSHLRSYFHALEQVRAGSLISLTAISVILSRLDFLKKITTTNLSDHSTLN